MDLTHRSSFYVGDWLVEPAVYQLSNGSRSVRIQPKFMKVLVCLAEQADTVVTREHLLDEVWADTVVVDVVLTRAISELRKIFGDDPRAPSFLETIPKIGYRLIAEVRRVPAGAPPHLASPAQARAKGVARTHPIVIGARPRWLLTMAIVLAVLATGYFVVRPSIENTGARLLQTVTLTSLRGEEMEPAFSPDGRFVAFTRFPGQPGDSVDIYTLDITTNTMHRVTADPDPDMAPTWSPDGTRLAFVRRQAGKHGIYLVSASGGIVQPILPLACACWPTLHWSPTDKEERLLFSDQRDGAAAMSLYIVDPTGQEVTQLTAPGADAEDTQARFSPDGRRIAFVRTSQGQRNLLVMSASGGPPTPLLSQVFEINGLSWAADGASIYFASRGNLWQLPVAGGSPRWVTTTSLHLSRPDYGATANQLVYTQTLIDSNIWHVSLTDTAETPQQIVGFTQTDRAPQWSPDGQHIAFVSNQNGNCELWSSRTDGSDARRLVSLPGRCANTLIPRWSPDGQYLVFATQQAGHSDVYLMGAAGGLIQEVTQDTHEEVFPSWSSDGQWIYFGSDRGGSWQIWKVPQGGGDPVQVTTAGGFVALEDPAGAFVYYTRQGQPGLYRVPVEGGGEEPVLGDLPSDDFTNWRITTSGLYYLARTPDMHRAAAVHRLDLETRQGSLITTIPSTFASCAQVDFSPDGRRMLFVQIDYAGSDLLMIEPMQ